MVKKKGEVAVAEPATAITVREPGAADISIYDDGAFLPAKATVDYWLDIAGHFVKNRITPQALDTPAKVLAVWLYAREMGVQAMRALGKLYVIDGHVGMYGELMVEQVRRGGVWFEVIEHNEEICRIKGYRPHPGGETETHEAQFTYKEAVGAGLAKKTNWQRYRRDMLQWRAVARLLRFLAPDLVHSAYLPDEIKSLSKGMTDFPPGTPEYIEHVTGQTGQRAIAPVDAPGLKTSARKKTGKSRITPEKEPEGGPAAAERADLGGSDSEGDKLAQNGTSPETPGNGPSAAPGAGAQKDTPEGPWVPPAAVFGPEGASGPDVPPKVRGHLEGWKGFVRGMERDAVPTELGPRAANWWQSGFDSAKEWVENAIEPEDREAPVTDEEAAMRAGVRSAFDGEDEKTACPYDRGTQERFFWLTGYRGAKRLGPPAPADDTFDSDPAPADETAPAESETIVPDEPFDREVWESEAIDLMGKLNLGVEEGQKLLGRVYKGQVLDDLSDLQLQDFVTKLRGTCEAKTDDSWMN